MSEIVAIAKKAKEAAHRLSYASTELKNKALLAMADSLDANAAGILSANELDLDGGRQRGLSSAMLDRLALSNDRLSSIAQGLRDVASLADPAGEIVRGWVNPNGLSIQQVRTPIGVIAMVYEARPNVTVDAAGLCIKSGNAAILRGGSEAVHSNWAISKVLVEAAEGAGLPTDSIQMIPTQEHEAVVEMLKLNGLIDLVIPRGSERLISMVVNNATIPVIKHFKGMCHLYIDKAADKQKAIAIAVNAKAQRPSTCNSIETILIHRDCAALTGDIVIALQNAGVEVRGDEFVQQFNGVVPATGEDWSTEYLDLIVSIKMVDDFDAAADHIRTYSSGLAEAIVTEDYSTGRKFMAVVDSAAVYLNASTRFTDGAEFGLGAEIGITTDKVFPRGPMGLRELTSSKYVIYGEGQIRT